MCHPSSVRMTALDTAPSDTSHTHHEALCPAAGPRDAPNPPDTGEGRQRAWQAARDTRSLCRPRSPLAGRRTPSPVRPPATQGAGRAALSPLRGRQATGRGFGAFTRVTGSARSSALLGWYSSRPRLATAGNERVPLSRHRRRRPAHTEPVAAPRAWEPEAHAQCVSGGPST